MSAWSEYNAGLLTEAEYNGACREDEWLNDHWDPFDDDELVDGLDLLDEEDLFLEDNDGINE